MPILDAFHQLAGKSLQFYLFGFSSVPAYLLYAVVTGIVIGVSAYLFPANRNDETLYRSIIGGVVCGILWFAPGLIVVSAIIGLVVLDLALSSWDLLRWYVSALR